MRQRGRKSAAALVEFNVTGKPARQEPPSHLSDDERALFVELVESCAPSHFVKSDLPLLVSFVQATLLVRRAATGMVDDPDLIAVFEKSVKLQATLATRLRLAPQSRLDPKSVARQQPYPGRKPWDPVE
jgi:hypothetical protein